MKTKRNLLFCALLIVSITAAVHTTPPAHARRPLHPKRPIHAKPVFNRKQFKETSGLISKAIEGIEQVESLMMISYGLASRSAMGSYSTDQRLQMQVEFQAILAMIDSTVDRATFMELNMLDSADEVISLSNGNKVLEFNCVDITLAGLGLDVDLNISDWSEIITTYEKMYAAVRQIKVAGLQFNDYMNTLSKYDRSIKPNFKKEILLWLEIMNLSRKYALAMKTNLERASELAEQVIIGSYSNDQRVIMNAEFGEMLSEVTRISTSRAPDVYFGMGSMIGSTDIIAINTGSKVLKFRCFDLTEPGVGSDSELSILTKEQAEAAYPYIINAIPLAEEAVTGLDEYIEVLSKCVLRNNRRFR